MNKNESASGQILTIALAAILVSAVCAIADDFSPPPWERNTDGTTFQKWSFDASADKGPMAPDESYNIYDEPLLRVDTTANWNQGAWPLTGEIDILIPNRPQSDPGSYKEIWLQLTWKGADLDPFLWDEPFVSLRTHPAWDEYESLPPVSTEENGWTHTLFKIKVWPNPYEEMITLKGDIIVDQVVVDTRCVIPEPATLALISGGAFLAIRRRRNG